MDDKYSRTVGEKSLTLMRVFTDLKIDRNMENMMDRYDRLITNVKR